MYHLICKVVLLLFVFFMPQIVQGMSPDDMSVPQKMKPTDFHDGYYVLVSDVGNDKWSIEQISSSPLVRSSLNEELLFVSKSYDIVTPYFVKRDVGYNILYGYLWGCEHYEHAPAEQYNICNSSFGSNFIAMKKLNTSKIITVVKQTDMLNAIEQFKLKAANEASQCNADRAKIAEAKKRIHIDPTYHDLSGLYNHTPVYVFTTVDLQTCPIDFNKDIFQVSAKKSVGPFDAEVSPQIYLLKYQDGDYVLTPHIKVISKKINKIEPYAQFKNKQLTIVLNSVTLTNVDLIEYVIDFSNQTTKYLNISDLAFYVNDSIITIKKSIDLPPMSTKKQVRLAVYQNSLPSTEDKEAFHRTAVALRLTADEQTLQSADISLGISARYEIDKENNTLFESHTFPIARMVK